jgi:hypothetical protein
LEQPSADTASRAKDIETRQRRPCIESLLNSDSASGSD